MEPHGVGEEKDAWSRAVSGEIEAHKVFVAGESEEESACL